MTDESDLLAAVLANPADDHVRLVYADWLQENGQEDRAEFIRVQVELAQELIHPEQCVVPHIESLLRVGYTEDMRQIQKWRGFEALQRRQGELLSAVGPSFLSPHSPFCGVRLSEPVGPHYASAPVGLLCRGFIESVTCTAADWLAHAEAIRAAQPVTRVTLTTPLLMEWIRQRKLRDGTGPVVTEWKWRDGGTHTTERLPFFERDAENVMTINVDAILADAWPGITFELPPVELNPVGDWITHQLQMEFNPEMLEAMGISPAS